MLTFTLFGATGDLARRKLFPSLNQLAKEGRLPEEFLIQAIGRRPYDTAEFLTHLPSLPDLAGKIVYIQMDISVPTDYPELVKRGGSQIFYLAIEPNLLEPVIRHLGTLPKNAETQVVLEKPFGFDVASASHLDGLLKANFSEAQLFRLDHYLGKETVQNLLAFRFANPMIESFWSTKYIDHIQITVAEEEGIGTRGNFYDQTGAIRDIFQNHLLQVVALLLMQRPAALSFDALADSVVAVINSLTVSKNDVVCGQYQSYSESENVPQTSKTETFLAAKLASSFFDTVPIYIRTGKALARRVSEISIQLRDAAQPLYNCEMPNLLTLRLQPEEGINLQLLTKVVGSTTDLQTVSFEFCFGSLTTRVPEAYESLFLSIFAGDHTFALRSDVIEASWKLADLIRSFQIDQTPEMYPVGSWGPASADQLIEKDGRAWQLREHTFCNGVQVTTRS